MERGKKRLRVPVRRVGIRVVRPNAFDEGVHRRGLAPVVGRADLRVIFLDCHRQSGRQLLDGRRGGQFHTRIAAAAAGGRQRRTRQNEVSHHHCTSRARRNVGPCS